MNKTLAFHMVNPGSIPSNSYSPESMRSDLGTEPGLIPHTLPVIALPKQKSY